MEEHNPKVISKELENNTATWKIHNGTKLSEVLDFLPFGIVNKTETGIGATTLELNSERNSIIVEPLRVTASSKAKKTKGSLYVGSSTKAHPHKVTDEIIKKYVSTTDGNCKKIIVVADSLPRVIEAIGNDVYKDYFLMIDEIDAFQNDSNFRDSMEKCLDIYKRFPVTGRALVSATQIGFSDPELEKEHLTTIKYESPSSREIALNHTDNVPGTAYETIVKLQKEHPEQKIVVAYNSVNGCVALANLLVKDKGFSPDTIKILCSTANKDNAGKYFAELDGETLPGSLTFLTSAYFNGFDLEEKYHLVSVSDPKLPVTALSDHKLKQIAGRSRRGLLSETVVYGTTNELPEEITTADKEGLIRAAVDEIKALECIEKNFQSNRILKHSLHKIREMIVEKTRHMKYSLVRMDVDRAPKVSYFNIDACLETIRVNKEVYQEEHSLKKLLEKENTITHFRSSVSKTIVKHDFAKDAGIRKRNVEQAIALLRDVSTAGEIRQLLYQPELSKLQRKIIEGFQSLWNNINREQLLENLESCNLNRDNRAWDNFHYAAHFAALHDNHPFKQRISRHFKVGDQLTGAQILRKLNAAYEESQVHQKIESEVSAVKRLKLYFNINSNKRDAANKRTHRIISENPKGVIVIKHITDTTSFDPAEFSK